MSEFDLINRYFKSSCFSRTDVFLDIGDDCAVLQPPAEKQLVMTTDTLVAGVHFPPSVSAKNIGFKTLAVNLSDLAAMGAEPAWAMLALTLPQADENWVSEFMQGFRELAIPNRLALIGGDTTTGPLSITLQLTGFISPSQCLRRDAARIGDKIYVSGTLGDAALGLQKMMAGLNTPESKEDLPFCVSRLNRPTPRLALGKSLVNIAYCGIDISDGLLADLGHITHASGCAAQIYLNRLPLSSELKKYYASHVNWQSILAGGDDYELCFTLAPQYEPELQRIATNCQVTVSCIGEITAGRGVHCFDEAGREIFFEVTGYDHFPNKI